MRSTFARGRGMSIACALALIACGSVTACGSSSKRTTSASTSYSQIAAPAACGATSSEFEGSNHLVTRYEPSQATGWPAPYSPTIGGHTWCVQVSYGHKTYRISLLSSGSSANPVYEAVPNDPTVAFEKTLAQEYGGHYAYRYLGGLPGGSKFVIESYGVRLYAQAKGLVWGSDLYAIYKPGKSGPAISSSLQFIQVVYTTRYGPSGGGGGRFVDAGQHPGSPTPYTGEGAGLTSIDGRPIVNFYDPGPGVLSPVSPHGGVGQVVRIETFLAKDTGGRDTAGKKIVDIYGGFKWGFTLETVE